MDQSCGLINLIISIQQLNGESIRVLTNVMDSPSVEDDRHDRIQVDWFSAGLAMDGLLVLHDRLMMTMYKTDRATNHLVVKNR